MQRSATNPVSFGEVSFSPSQQRAICHKDGPMLVLAGPGSGKTAVLTARIRYLIEQHQILPDQILVISFTRAAAGELKSRFMHLTNERYPQVHVSTFHSLFYQILQAGIPEKRWRITDASTQFSCAKTVLEIQHPLPSENALLEDFLSNVSRYKAGEEHLRSKPQFLQLFGRYERLLFEHGVIDLDDLMIHTRELLSLRADFRETMQQQYSYIMVDEYQDISPMQFECLRLLTGTRENLFVVGDDDQAIYRFRGSCPKLMQQFPAYYPRTEVILLETNYRCPDTIVEASLRLIGHNTVRFPKKLRARQTGGIPVESHGFVSEKEECEYICREVKQHIKRGSLLSEVAVLYRNRKQSCLLTSYLMQQHIPFIQKETVPDFERYWFISDLLAYIRLASDNGTAADFLAIMNKPYRSLSPKTFASTIRRTNDRLNISDLFSLSIISKSAKEALYRLQNQCRMLCTLPPYASIQYIRSVIGYDSYLQSYAKKKQCSYTEWKELLDQFAECLQPVASWQDYAQMKQELRQRQKNPLADGIRLMTMHGAKGLEFEHVYLLDVNEGIVPYQRGGLMEDLEEERRLFYVAMTRAKKELQLLYTQTRQPSRFLSETLPTK